MAEESRTGEDRRIAELLRVNGELAAEIRDLSLGRRTQPRTGQLPAARSVAKLQAERDSLATELQASRAEVDRLIRETEEQGRQIESQTRQIEALSREVAMLRGGVAGVLRRARARLLLHR
jgi:biotin operon repressor